MIRRFKTAGIVAVVAIGFLTLTIPSTQAAFTAAGQGAVHITVSVPTPALAAAEFEPDRAPAHQDPEPAAPVQPEPTTIEEPTEPMVPEAPVEVVLEPVPAPVPEQTTEPSASEVAVEPLK